MNKIVDSYPLSPLQEGMLFNALYAPSAGVDITQIICRMHERLDVPRFRSAWDAIVARYTILRTGFRWEGLENPIQEVHESASIELAVCDWRSVPAAEREAKLDAFLEADRRRNFDITTPPLIRVAVLEIGPEETWLVWPLHHLLLDAFSCAIILKEVFIVYEASLGGSGVSFPPALPYRAYIDWLGTQDPGAAETFWRETLAGYSMPVSISVAHDPHRPSRERAGYGKRELSLPASLRSALRALAKENGFTLYNCFQAAWTMILGRYGGVEDVVFGAIRGCRGVPIEGADSIIGMFINTLPVRARVSNDTSVVSFLKELRAYHLATRRYEHGSLARIQRLADVPPGMPLFESLMNYQSRPWDAMLLAEGGKWLTRELSVRHRTNYPIALDIYEEPELLIIIDYVRERFDDGAVEAMLGHYRSLLEGIAGHPERKLGELEMLTAAEKRTILVDWNATAADYPRDGTIHGLFESRAAACADTAAVSCNNLSLTYRELDTASNRLARRLARLGAGRGTLVAVCMDRNVDLIVGLLGALKAGAAYVPLDPAYPAERLAFMLADTHAPVLLTEQRLLAKLPPHEARTILLDADRADIAAEDGSNVASGAGPDDLAYVIYTSGSTGTPKGVCIRHRSVLNLLADFDRRRALSAGDPCSLWTSVSFDVSVYEIFSALLAGGTLCIATDAIRFDGAVFMEWMRENRIASAYIPPLMLSDFAAWVERNPGAAAMKRLLVGVEPINELLLAAIAERIPGLVVVNGYGPTEATVSCTLWTLDPSAAVDRNVPIGRPVQNSQIYLLDARRRPVPVGVPGEILVGGDGLATGYLNRPDLTGERFVPNPFGSEGSRLYRTGDLARYSRDGSIEFIGRIDYQVKIRGFRVEPGEIEIVLGQHPNVKDAVVLARADRSGSKRLVAYAVPAAGAELGAGDLRDYLKEKLPDYMVPTAFVMMDSFPLTPNGKLDRSKLPEPELSRSDLRAAYVAPRTEVEARLAAIWEKVLGVKQIGVTDNFFELGGHSVLAVRIFAEITKTLGTQIELAAIFQSPTIEELARTIDRDREAAPRGAALVPLHPDGSKPPVFFVHAFGGGVFFYRDLAERLGPDQPFYGFQSIGLDGTERPHTTVEQMAAQYIREMRGVQPRGPYYIGGRCLGAYVAFEMANQLHAAGERVGLLAILDSYWAPQAELAFRAGIAHHARNLMKGSLRERADYFWRHVGYRMIKNQIWLARVVSEMCFRAGRPIPSFMKDFYVNTYIPEMHGRAERKYKPSVYPGAITFFQATAEMERNPSNFWGQLTSGGLEVHMVPASHVDILVPPNVQVLAEKLGAALERARSGG